MIVVTGLACTETTTGVERYLREKKSKKYLGVQDQLAVLSAGDALRQARCEGELGERTGLFVAVGYIPFELRDIDPVLERSLEDGRFSMKRFSEGGYQRAHPLLAFRCLPNMPAYHIAANFGIEGPYQVSYPSGGQLYLALEQAVAALTAGSIDRALVAGVAHQRNFLVEHHHRRIGVAPDELRDAGATAVLERAEEARAPMARLEELSIGYETFDPLTDVPGRHEPHGPAALWFELSAALGKPFTHELRSRDGIIARSRWAP